MRFILLTIFTAISLFANEFQTSTDFYFNARYINSDGLQGINTKKLTSNRFLTRLGVRHHRAFGDNLIFDMDLRGVYEYIDVTDYSESNTYLELKRAWVKVPKLFNYPISLQLGRIQYKDTRTWWFENTLDMVKFFHKETLLSWDISAGGRLSDEKATASEQRVSLKDSKYIIAHLDYHYYYKNHFEFFSMYEDNGQKNKKPGEIRTISNQLKSKSKLSWAGIRFRGIFSENFRYWGDFAYVDGKTENITYKNNIVVATNDISVSGFGLDTGIIYKKDNYGIGGAIAYGSGDKDTKNSQHTFLQPTISNNKSRIIGNTRYRYYGEMLDPQLSNITILSLYGGAKVYDGVWIEGNYHKYMQNTTSSHLRASNLFISTNGTGKDIGQEVDMILGAKFKTIDEAQLVVSGFFGGNAFDNIAKHKDGYRAVIDFKIYW